MVRKKPEVLAKVDGHVGLTWQKFGGVEKDIALDKKKNKINFALPGCEFINFFPFHLFFIGVYHFTDENSTM